MLQWGTQGEGYVQLCNRLLIAVHTDLWYSRLLVVQFFEGLTQKHTGNLKPPSLKYYSNDARLASAHTLAVLHRQNAESLPSGPSKFISVLFATSPNNTESSSTRYVGDTVILAYAAAAAVLEQGRWLLLLLLLLDSGCSLACEWWHCRACQKVHNAAKWHQLLRPRISSLPTWDLAPARR